MFRLLNSALSRNLALKSCFCSKFMSTLCPCRPEGVVTIVDVSCAVGENLALYLAQSNHVKELRLYCECRDTCGIATELNHIDTKPKIVSYKDNMLREAITGCNVVVTAGGCRTSVHQEQTDLFDQNAYIVQSIALHLTEFNPGAVFLIERPPVEGLVVVASEMCKKHNMYDPRKIIGIANLQSMIANHFIAIKQSCNDPFKYSTPILGGVSPDGLVAAISSSSAIINLSTDDLECIRKAIQKAENAVVEAKCADGVKNGMLSMSRALAVGRFVDSVLKGLNGDQNSTQCGFIRQTGHIEEFLPYMTSIIKLGVNGVASSHMPKISPFEEQWLKSVEKYIRQNIELGVHYVHGNFRQDSRVCDWFIKEKVAFLDKQADKDLPKPKPRCN